MSIKKEFKLIIPIVIIFLGLGSFFLPYFSTNNLHIQNIDIDLKFKGDDAFVYLEDQLNLGYRIPGTQAREDCANYFISKFKEIDSNFTYVLHNFTIHSTNCQNVLFKLNENQSNIVILGAHYDSRAKATKDSTNTSAPVPGANDGASGSAVLIELAKAFYDVRVNLSCQIWFLFFDAEDQGYDVGPGIVGWDWIEGSKKFVNDIENFYDSQIEEFKAMILLDMVGGKNLRFINEEYSTSSLLDELFAIGRELGYRTQFPSNPTSGGITDDHVPFRNIGIPSADLIINFWNDPNGLFHHTTEDNINNTDESSLEVTGRTVEQFIYNNYFNTTNETYKGNYPWLVDIDRTFVETVMFLIIITAIGAIVIITVKIVKKKPLSKR
ncbi:MAG: M28 family peptidase [Promethearchaeota archaeon]